MACKNKEVRVKDKKVQEKLTGLMRLMLSQHGKYYYSKITTD